MLAPDFFHRKFPPGTGGNIKKLWYPLRADARWKTVLFRLAGLYAGYALARYLLVPEMAWIGDGEGVTLLFFNVAFSLSVFALGFGVVFATMIHFWRKYRDLFPGFNHAVNIAIPPMAVLCVLMVWVEMTDPRFSETRDTAPPATLLDG